MAHWLDDLRRLPPPPRKYGEDNRGMPELSPEALRAQAQARKEYAMAAVCPVCGCRAGFAPGTGDCGCGVPDVD